MSSYTAGVVTTGLLSRHRARPALVATGVVIVLLCFVLATPRSGGPDEASHMVASAALVRGEVDGDVVVENPALRTFDIPLMVGFPDPGCWAQQPQVPAGCAPEPPADNPDVPRATTSYNYPPWAYVLPGLASFVAPPDWYAYLARLFMAVIPVALVCASLARARRIGRGAAVAVLVGLTPIAWFSMSIVNPSAVAIAGGLALWAALLVPRPGTFDVLLVAGWVATLLPRRDGPIWATLIVLAVCLLVRRSPRDLFRSTIVSTRVVLAAALVLPPATALFNEQRGLNLLLSLAPLSLVGVDALCRLWSRFPERRTRLALSLSAVAVGTVVLALAVAARPGGYDPTVTRIVVGKSGEHLRQLVGVLGWLDTPAPLIAVFAFWSLFGILLAAALIEAPRVAAVGAGAIAAVVVTAWILELGQGDPGGTYWQGRYSMPFVVGLPLAIAVRARSSTETSGSERPGDSSILSTGRVAVVLAIAVWAIWNLTFVAALHRWGAGLDGTWPPGSWESWDAPLGPVALIVLHAIGTSVLVYSQVGPVGRVTADPEERDDTVPVVTTGVTA